MPRRRSESHPVFNGAMQRKMVTCSKCHNEIFYNATQVIATKDSTSCLFFDIKKEQLPAATDTILWGGICLTSGRIKCRACHAKSSESRSTQ